MAIYENVRNILRERGISVATFEEGIGLQRGGFYKWNNHAPSIVKAKDAADYLNVSIDELMEEKEGKD